MTFSDRKMAVPGHVVKEGGKLVVETNWKMDLPLAAREVRAIEVKDLDSGRFIAA